MCQACKKAPRERPTAPGLSTLYQLAMTGALCLFVAVTSDHRAIGCAGAWGRLLAMCDFVQLTLTGKGCVSASTFRLLVRVYAFMHGV